MPLCYAVAAELKPVGAKTGHSWGFGVVVNHASAAACCCTSATSCDTKTVQHPPVC